MASNQPSRLNKTLRSSSPAHIVTASNSSVKGASRPSSPRPHSSNSNHQPYRNQLRSTPASIHSIKHRPITNSINSTASSRSRSSSRPTSPSPITGPSGTAIKHALAARAVERIRSSMGSRAHSESLADFSIAASKRGQYSSYGTTNTSQGVPSESVGVTRSRSHYVSFPNFDEVDFVDVAMVEDDGEEDDAQDWSGPDSPPEGQHPMMDTTTADMENSSSGGSLDEKMMRPIGGHGYESMTLVGMPTSPSQHWLLQLETYHEQRVSNGVEA
ncbi:hypothetical protein BGZ70_006119 [Mortierella alpina]|uniref:Uncharacterized protein n=1 Tax=Mortierella alpina TaxID=64518 RepID=A0A9P6J8C2_MORAP|nr:hypothetical protein BGZ70_006119 [Mortierella alpina]